jgi:hypothetical protein
VRLSSLKLLPKPRLESSGNRALTALLTSAHRCGPLALVELLIRAGVLTWYGDPDGKLPLDYARIGVAPDKDEIGSRLYGLSSERSASRKLEVSLPRE